MSNYTLYKVLKDCQKLKFEANLSYRLTGVELEMIGLAYIRGEQRQLEKHIADLDLVKKTKRKEQRNGL